MDIYGYIWVHKTYAWVYMGYIGISGYIWVFIGIYGGIYGYIWVYMGKSG